jgi:TonB-dependent starch-binding outer membrane protein SusC
MPNIYSLKSGAIRAWRDLFRAFARDTRDASPQDPNRPHSRQSPVLVFNFIAFLLLTATAMAQDSKIVTGKISDEKGAVMPGVSVRIKEDPSLGTATDANGSYSLRVNANATIVFSFIGYKTVEIPVANQSSIDVQLSEDIETLNEVVVVGYGTQDRKDVTGAVATLSSEDLNQGAFTNPMQQIAGRAPGVNVTQVGSEPGSSPSVRIRGITSLIGGNDPLVVVDGVQGNMDLLTQVPPGEIASIDVLKDASATAIYGSRGAPGVIIVTTKKGKEGKVTVEYNATASVDFIPKHLKVLDANNWWTQAQANGVPAAANHGSNTDWFNLLTRPGSTQNHTLSFGGGSESFTYRASLTAILQQGVVINSDYKRYIGSISATQRALNDRLTLTMSLNSGVNNTVGSPNSVGRASFTSNLITNSYVMRPTDPILDVDGSYYRDPNVFQYINPYAVAETVVNEGKNNNLFGTFRADLEVIEGLTAGWFGTWRKTDEHWGYFLPERSSLAFAIDQHGIANITNKRQDERLMDISLGYKKEFGNHFIDALAVYEWQNQMYQGNFVQAKGFKNDIATYNALQLGDLSRVLPGDISSYKNDRTLISFLGRVNYSYLDRYLLTASFRRDGSSVFGENHKWGNFPSASVAWRVDQERFMDDQGIFSQLKLRAGYGVTGNQQGLFPQNSLSLVGLADVSVTYFGGQAITNYKITQNANKDLRWETRKQTNVGLDFGLINNKITGSIDAFTATTDNLLFNYTVPQPPYPYPTMVANLGSLVNRGLEISLSYELIKTTNTTVSLSGNAAFLQNEVTDLNGSINGVPLNTDYVPWGPNSFLVKGKPVGTFNILEHTGTNEQRVETVHDRNSDGTIDQGIRSEDRYFAGSALPKYTFAFTPAVRYKNLDFAMVWRGAGGHKVYNNLRQSLSMLENIGRANVLESAVPLGIYTSPYGSDVWLEDASFIRLDNLTLGYNVPLRNSKNIDRIRLSLTGTNLALITGYSGVDPELNVSGSNGFGGDNGIYPRTRSIAAGLNIILK